MSLISKEKIIEVLHTVIDPEIDMDIYTMGLIYDVEVRDDGSVFVLHTLTSPTCPLGPTIQDGIRMAIMSLGVTDVEIELTFDPFWQAPEGLRPALGI